MDDFKKVKIFNVTKFKEYSETEQQLFEAYRNAQLVLTHKWDGKNWDDDDIEMVEKSAFVYVDFLPDSIRKPEEYIQSIVVASGSVGV